MYTIGQLKEDIKGFSDNAEVSIDGEAIKGLQSLSDGTLFLSSNGKIGECRKCGHAVYKLKNYSGGEYVGRCPNCKKNRTEFSINIYK